MIYLKLNVRDRVISWTFAMLVQSLRALGAIAVFSSMLLTHAQNATSNKTAWDPSSNTSQRTNTTTAVPVADGATSTLWLLGIFLEVVATFVGTAGKQLVRYSTILTDRRLAADAAATPIDSCVISVPLVVSDSPTADVGTQTPAPTTASTEAMQQRTCSSWITPTVAIRVGLCLNTACGPLLEMAAYTFAPQSTLAPFGGLDTVWNAMLAPFTLGETMTRQ